MKKFTVFVAATACIVSLAACGKPGTPNDTKSSGLTALETPKAPGPHDMAVTASECNDGKDCQVDVMFRKDPTVTYMEKRRNFSCYEKSYGCSCYGDDFCSADVVMQVRGKQYTGVITSVGMNDTLASIRLPGTRDVANLLVGDGTLYAKNETPPALSTSAPAQTASK